MRSQARHPKVDVPASRLKTDIAKILKDEGYIANYKLTEEGAKKSIRIYLKYTPGNVPVISRIERVSRPGCRVYVGSKQVPRVLGGLGINILTTPRGVMTGIDGAQGRRRRRSAVSRLVGGDKYYVTSRKKADSAAEGREDHRRRAGLDVEGPKGKQTVPVPAGITLQQKDGMLELAARRRR